MKINLLFAFAFLSIIIYANINYEHGIIGHTKRDGDPGCLCHNLTPTDTVFVWIEGSDSVFIGDTITYKLFMTGGPAVAGGFDLASYFGVLYSVDTLTQNIAGELTHTYPIPFINDTVSWNFLYTAPDSIVTDTLYSVANSVNGNGIPTLDQWNFGNNFIVHIIDEPVKTEIGKFLPEKFVLYQNYPNPFNPTTKIKFTILSDVKREVSYVTLNVYDVLGKEVATLVNEVKSAGEYEVEFSSAGLTGGIYFYQLSAGNFSEIKKMVLLK
jgi:hypothetical protein